MSLSDLAKILPPSLLESSHNAARELYGPHRAGWVSCQFKTWTEEQLRPPEHELLIPMQFGEKSLEAQGFWGVTLILEGRFTVQMPGNEPIEAGPGSLLWFYGDAYGQIPFVAHAGARECAFSMDLQTARRLEDVALLRFGFRLDQQPLSTARVLDFLDLFQTFCDARLATPTILRRVMTFLDRLEPPDAHGTSPDWVRRACHILETHPEPTFSMHDAARLTGVPYLGFRREFRRIMGIPPIQYQLEARMRRARELLKTRSVKETAALLGYSDPYLFSRQFKRVTGVAPSEFRAA